MNDVEFERLLSHKIDGICLRDLIFTHYEQVDIEKGTESVNLNTKKYTDSLYAVFVTRKA